MKRQKGRVTKQRTANVQMSRTAEVVQASQSHFALGAFTVCSGCFLVLLLSGVIVVGSCLLHRSFESLQFKSSSTLVLHKACSIKLCSSAAFCDHIIYRPALKGFRLSLVKTQSSRNTQLKSARHFLLCPMAKIFQTMLFLLQK